MITLRRRAKGETALRLAVTQQTARRAATTRLEEGAMRTPTTTTAGGRERERGRGEAESSPASTPETWKSVALMYGIMEASRDDVVAESFEGITLPSALKQPLIKS